MTIANNVVQNSFPTDGGGIARGDGAAGLTVRASIVSGNTIDDGVLLPVPSNCGGTTLPTSSGGNVVGTTDCAFTGPADAQGVNPLLSPTLVDAGGQTDVRTISSASPALDRAAGCSGADQRDFGRPQGPACDSGAYEVDQAPDTALSGTGPTFTFSSPEPGATFQCRSPWPPSRRAPPRATYSGLAPGDHTFFVRAVDSAGNVDPTPPSQAFTVQEPAPQFHRTVVVKELRGTVRVRSEGQPPVRRARRRRGIPLGSTVDTKERRGGADLEARPEREGAEGEVLRRHLQGHPAGEDHAAPAQRGARGSARAGGASAAAKKPKKRRLWGDGRGKFRTKGSYSSATVRGTKWLVSDSCAGTLTRVVRGVVSVRDILKRKTVRVRAGKRYLARPPG